MTIRFRAASVASMALVLGLSMAAAGCGKYSWGTLSAVKSFKDGNLLYAQKDWKKAAEKYEAVVSHEDAFASCPSWHGLFLPGNSYDQLYKPAKQGTRQRAYIQKAITSARRPTRTPISWKKSRWSIGRRLRVRQAERPGQGQPVYRNHRPRAEGARQLHGARQAV
jgi:hypothetical protein